MQNTLGIVSSSHLTLRATVPKAIPIGGQRRHYRHFLENIFSVTAVCGDLLVVVLGFIIAYWVRLVSGWIPVFYSGINHPSFFGYWKLILLGWAIVFVGMLRENLYRYEYVHSPRKMMAKFVGVLTVSMLIFLGLSLVAKTDPPISRIFVFCAAVVIFVIFCGWRLILSRVVRSHFFNEKLRRHLLIVGWSKHAARIRALAQSPTKSIWHYVGWLGARTSHPYIVEKEYLGSLAELKDVLHAREIDVVLVADMEMSAENVADVADMCEREHVDFRLVPRSFEVLVSGLHASSIGNVPVLGVEALHLQEISNQIIKRGVDIIGGGVGLLLSVPIIAVCGTLVYLESPGSIFYRQVRTGINGQRFKMLKIRSMKPDAEADGAQWAQKDDPRRLRIGAFLRKWNLDELPQFWNVLNGDMSLVGPRPERPELIEQFKYKIPHYNARHTCKPGMTGWAQVNGWRGNTDLEERIRHDIWYVENWSLWLDFKIMALTFVKQENAY